jgi:hypothetical protein
VYDRLIHPMMTNSRSIVTVDKRPQILGEVAVAAAAAVVVDLFVLYRSSFGYGHDSYV